MHMDPILPVLVAAAFGVLLIGAVARRLKQPYVIAYLLAGVALGPSGFAVFEDAQTLSQAGSIGVILLLFFVGMEVDLARLATGWRISVLGTLLQVLVSVLLVGAIGLYLDWPLERVVLLGFAISLSSTALVVSVLRESDELNTPVGSDALGILLVQDVAVVVMFIVIGLFVGEEPSLQRAGMQAVGGAAFVALLIYLVRGNQVRLPFQQLLREDHELQVLAAFVTCFGLAWLSALFGLSTAIGAFAAGLVVARAQEADWFHRALEPARVLFVAAFFVSIGTLIDLPFLFEHKYVIAALILGALFTNTLVNGGILRALGRDWSTSLYAGALLSQVGEFSFVLAAVGRQGGIIGEYAYQGVIGVIAGTLLLTPVWIGVMGRYRTPKLWLSTFRAECR